MSDIGESAEKEMENRERRCPNCDTVVSLDAERCLMCGLSLPIITAEPNDTQPEPKPDLPQPLEAAPEPEEISEPAIPEEPIQKVEESDPEPADPELAEPEPEPEPKSELKPEPELEPEFESPPPALMVEPPAPVRQEGLSPSAVLVTAIVMIISFSIGGFIIRRPSNQTIIYLPTNTPIPPTSTFTHTPTPTPTGTLPPTETPTITLTPLPTDTPKPPRFHTVAANETLFGLGLFYGITPDSIAEANGLPPGSGIQVSQSLVIPWPTATPPLVPIEVEIGGQSVVADPTDCEFYQIQDGDTLFGIASRRGVDLRAILAVNRLSDQVVLQPGDVLCIPRIIRNGVLPPTPGPSPTPTQTPPPPGPQLLYPIEDAVVEPAEGPLVLQWAAVKDLAPNEWYMVEVTNLSLPDSHPMRGFTRRTAFRVPSTWRPTEDETHFFRWQVSIVQVTGEREDGSFIYTFGGNSSQPDFFSWLGAIPN